MFEFLFKYRPVVFQRGDFVFAAPWPFWLVAIAGLAAGAGAVYLYARPRPGLARRDRLVLGALRVGAIALLVFCLAGPALILATVVPQQNFVAVLVDDSQSMRIADEAGATRGATAAAALDAGGPLLRGLTERFKVRLFRFSEDARRLPSTDSLAFAGRRTDLGRALTQAHRQLAAVPLAGLVVVTDGGDNAGDGLTDALAQLRASGVPVHTVGLGRTRFDHDLELSRATTPRAVLRGTAVSAEVTLRHAGYAGQTVPLVVEHEGRIVSTRDVTLPREGEVLTVRAHFTVAGRGPQRFRFTVPPQAGEAITENNTVEAIIEVDDRRERILYFEGEPRFEVKFLRRAVADDENLEVAVLQRTAENKFLRLGIEDSTELAAGFPRTRQELFRYRGLVLGSVEASFFTHDQLQMIAEFVSVRGGGLLALGGRSALAEGGYTDTPVADALPVVLDPPADRPFFAEVRVGLTPFGRTHPVTQFRSTPDASAARIDSLPVLSMVNPVRSVKPGASTLLTGRAEAGEFVVLAYQRYGRGKAIAFPVQDSWIWQMHADIPLEDLTHETLWRQLLRWLVSGVVDPVGVASSADRIEVGREVTITADVADSGYLRLNGADVSATIVDPAGDARTMPMQWTVERDGEYRLTFAPPGAGLYEVRVEARAGGAPLGAATAYVQVGTVDAEYFGAEMREPLLRRVADETGGRFYTAATMGTLPEDVSLTESGATVHEQRDLWDMPIVLLLLVGLLSAEWTYRRARGLP